MAGPHPPNPAVGATGSQYVQPYRQTGTNEPHTQEYPDDFPGTGPRFAARRPGDATVPPTAFPGQLPPVGPYPKRHTKWVLIGTLVTITVIAALTIAIMCGVRGNGGNTAVAFSDKSAKAALQGYLDALEHHDIDTLVRNTLCGIYDGVRDRRSDQALAKLNSDAFRRQYSKAEVTSIDKIVRWSQFQAQVLFTMQMAPVAGGPSREQLQGMAQLLSQRNQIFVCSYVLRPTATY